MSRPETGYADRVEIFKPKDMGKEPPRGGGGWVGRGPDKLSTVSADSERGAQHGEANDCQVTTRGGTSRCKRAPARTPAPPASSDMA